MLPLSTFILVSLLEVYLVLVVDLTTLLTSANDVLGILYHQVLTGTASTINSYCIDKVLLT